MNAPTSTAWTGPQNAKRAAAEAHIARCWQNPEARGCKTCAHFTPPEEGPYPEHPGFPEQCGAGRSLADGLVTGCRVWLQRDQDGGAQ